MTAQDFDSFYREVLQPKLEALESRRKQVILKVAGTAIATILFMVLLYYRAPVLFEGNALLLYCGLYFLLIHMMSQTKSKEYTEIYKDEILPLLVGALHENLTYQRRNAVDEKKFKASNLFLVAPDEYFGDDYVSGKIGESFLEFSEVQASYLAGKKWWNIFSGIFFVITLPKTLREKVYVLSDKEARHSAVLIGPRPSENFEGKRVKLENMEFEKAFATYSENPVQARAILTPVMMERILNFRKQNAGNVSLAFAGSVLYAAFERSSQTFYFEPNLWQPADSFKQVKDFFDLFQNLPHILEDLKLNTGIWKN